MDVNEIDRNETLQDVVAGKLDQHLEDAFRICWKIHVAQLLTFKQPNTMGHMDLLDVKSCLAWCDGQ